MTPNPTPVESDLQGEGDYTAARRHRESVEEFVHSGKVDAAARAAAPENSVQARELLQAEAAGLAHARGEHVPHDAEARERLWDLIKGIRFGMLTTRSDGGYLQSRPMTTQNSELDEDATLWLFASRKGEAVADLAQNDGVCMSYADTDNDRYVSASGTATLSDDRAKKEQLWSAMAKAWFPGGVDDPDLALIRLNVTHADYWDVKSSKVVQLWRMASAAITGKPPTDIGEHGHLQLR